MKLFTTTKVDNYIIPVFVFLLLLCGDTGYHFRPVVTFVIPVCLLLTYILKPSKHRFFRQELTWVHKLVFIYVLWLAVTLVSAYDTSVSLYHFGKLCIFFCIVYVIDEWLDTGKKYKLLIDAGCIAAFGLATWVYVQYAIGDDGNMRIAGTYSNVNTGGFVLAMLTILSHYAYIIYKEKKYVGLSLYSAGAVVFTGSRAALLVLLVTVVIMFCRRKIPRWVFLLGIVFFLVVLFFVLYKMDVIWQLFRIENGTAGRNYLWIIAIQIIHDYFWTGIGLGNLQEVGTDYMLAYASIPEGAKKSLLENAIQSSHNMYLEAFVDSGILGFLLYLSILIFIFVQYKRGTKDSNPISRQLSYLMLGMICGVMVRGFFESNGFLCKGWLNVDMMFWLFFVLYKRKNVLYGGSGHLSAIRQS